MTTTAPVPHLSRRRWLVGCAAGIGGAAAGAEPIVRSGPPRLRLGLAAYSFRHCFGWFRGRRQEPAGRGLSLEEFIAYAAAQGCDAAELTAYFFDPAVHDDDLRLLRRRAFLAGISLSGLAIGSDFTVAPGPALDGEIAAVKGWIDRAAVLGVPHVRVFAGQPAPGRDPMAAVRQCTAALEECCGHAGGQGIMLGLENHGGLTATPDGLLAIVRGVRSPWLGINLDTGNFFSDDPYHDLERCAAHAVNVQYKIEVRRGPKARAEPTDAARIARILRDAGYQGFVALEYESREDPFAAVPRHLEKLRLALA